MIITGGPTRTLRPPLTRPYITNLYPPSYYLPSPNATISAVHRRHGGRLSLCRPLNGERKADIHTRTPRVSPRTMAAVEGYARPAASQGDEPAGRDRCEEEIGKVAPETVIYTCSFCILTVAFSCVLSGFLCSSENGQNAVNAHPCLFGILPLMSGLTGPQTSEKVTRWHCTPEHWLWYAYSTVTTVYRQTVGVMDTICRQDEARL